MHCLDSLLEDCFYKKIWKRTQTYNKWGRYWIDEAVQRENDSSSPQSPTYKAGKHSTGFICSDSNGCIIIIKKHSMWLNEKWVKLL